MGRLSPSVAELALSMAEAASGISPVIDTRVFVAAALSDDPLPAVLEFVPFDAASASLIQSAEAGSLAALLRDSARTTLLANQLSERDAVAAAALRFLCEATAFQSADNFDGAVEIYHKFLSDESVELVPVKPEVKRAIFARVEADNYADKMLFEEACKVCKRGRSVCF